jgi:hypothetical protein
MVSVLILVVAIIALVGLAYQTVPISTTTTIVRQSTETGFSYSPYDVVWTAEVTTVSVQYPLLASATWALTQYQNGTIWCIPSYVAQYGGAACAMLIAVAFYKTSVTTAFPLTFVAHNTATIAYSQPVTNSLVVPGQSMVPAYSNLGLTDTAFAGLSVLVILLLAFMTVWIALKSKNSHRRK